MKRKILLDTSFIVAFLFEKDKYHEEAVRIVKHLAENVEFYIHGLVFQEAATVICKRCKERKIDCKEALEIYSEFVKQLNLIETPYKAFNVLEEMKNTNCSLSFIDTLLVKIAKKYKFEILTFDVNLKKALKSS